MPDEPGALWVPSSHNWAGQNRPTFVIVHGTGSSLTETAQNVAQFFQTNSPPTSTHYVIGRDGTVVQCVAEADAAWGNGVISAGADPWWTGNPNEYTCSIEHVNDSANSTPLSPAQQAASFALIAHICDRHGIPKRPADATGGITGHYSIDPVNRAHCPGVYPWDALFAALEGGNVGIPQGWTDDGTTLHDPHGVAVVRGFRDWVLAHPWAADNTPLAAEFGSASIEYGNATVGAGSRQDFRFCSLGWTQAWGVYVIATGQDVVELVRDRAGLEQQVTTLQAQLAVALKPDPQVTTRAAAFEQIKALADGVA
ncbi:MAG TPA: peptidoglycan recognition family protein [Ktedonobacterales bacterium]|nr:peptidoglycan recognition family protein [Ktedonobacterales bacterium]